MNEKIQPFEKFITELEMNEKISVDENNLTYILDRCKRMNLEEYDNWILEDCNIQVTKDHLDYMLSSGLILDWTNENVMKEKFSYIYGGFKLRGIYEPLVGKSFFWEPYQEDFKQNNQEETLTNLGYFQSSGHGNDGTFGCFYRKPKEYPFPIYFYDNGVYFPMSLNLDEYYEAMLFCKAVVLWQYFYIDPKEIVTTLKNEKCSNWISLYDDLPNNPSRVEGLIKHMNILIEQFPVLFPDFDISFFEEKRDSLVKEYNEVN